MSGDWNIVDHSRRKKKPKPPVDLPEEKAESLEEPEPKLNPLFEDKPAEKSPSEPVYELPPKPSNEWQLVGDSKRNKNRNKDKTPEVKPQQPQQQPQQPQQQPQQPQQQPQQPQQQPQQQQSSSKKRKKKKKNTGPVLTERERDELRARRAWRTGDKLEAWSAFHEEWVTAEVIGTQGEELTLKTLDGRQLELRTSDRIRPFFDESRKLYKPFPEKKPRKEKKKNEQPAATKKKVKRKKKNTAKKVTTEDEIKRKIHDIIKNFGDQNMWGLTEIQNKLSTHLQGGQWNSKIYKSKYGTFKKFISQHSDDFKMMENGAKIMRLEPVIVPSEKKPKTIKKVPESSSIFLPLVLLFFCAVVAVGIFLVSNPEIELSKLTEMVTNILKDSSSGKEL